MPPLPPVPNCLKLDTRYLIGNDSDVINRLHFTYTGGPPSSVDCHALAVVAENSWIAHLKAMLDSIDAYASSTITDLASSTGASGLQATQTTGTRAGGSTPAQCAALVNLGIARRYRGGKPRVYTPFGTASDLLSRANWTGAFQTALLAAWNAYIAAIIGASSGTTVISAQVSVSYYQGYNAATITPSGRAKNHPKLRSVPIVDAITTTAVNAIPGSQRRRARP